MSGNEGWSEDFRKQVRHRSPHPDHAYSLEQLFNLLLRLLSLDPQPDWNSFTTVWIQNSAAESCGNALVKLLQEKKYLDAYQIGFDLSEVAAQGFVEDVRRKLNEKDLGPGEGLVSCA